MSILIENEIEYPCTVSVSRPGAGFNESGDYDKALETIIDNMLADIQLSLKVRKLMSEDNTGSSENTVWIMFCNPPQTIQDGDIVSDGTRTFVVDAVGEWGSHTECIMRKV